MPKTPRGSTKASPARESSKRSPRVSRRNSTVEPAAPAWPPANPQDVPVDGDVVPDDAINAGGYVERTAASHQFCQRRCSLDAYDQTSITGAEVSKLVRSPEFQKFYRDNGERLQRRQRRLAASPVYVCCAALSVALFAAAYLPFVQDATAPSVSGKTLLELLTPRRRLAKLGAEIPMIDLVSVAAATYAAPLVVWCVFFVSMLRTGVVSHVVGVAALVTVVASLDALRAGLGFFVVFAAVLCKVTLV